MKTLPDFEISSDKTVSSQFQNKNISSFAEAIRFIRLLPYGRNKDKNNLTSLFEENCGTCSTKHALLKRLADEHDISDVKLIIGIFKMNTVNTPAVAQTLTKHNLTYLPEAHCYLKFQDERIDATKEGFDPSNYQNDLLEELEISPDQISEFKVNYHKKFLSTWLNEQPTIHYSLNELWAIREQCILDLED